MVIISFGMAIISLVWKQAGFETRTEGWNRGGWGWSIYAPQHAFILVFICLHTGTHRHSYIHTCTHTQRKTLDLGCSASYNIKGKAVMCLRRRGQSAVLKEMLSTNWLQMRGENRGTIILLEWYLLHSKWITEINILRTSA